MISEKFESYSDPNSKIIYTKSLDIDISKQHEKGIKTKIEKTDKKLDDNNQKINQLQGKTEAIEEQRVEIKEEIQETKTEIEELQTAKEELQVEEKPVEAAKQNILNKTRRGRKSKK